MTAPIDIEGRLRASLAEHARNAPPGGPLADRILAELEAPVLRPRHGWRTWTFPLLAAAVVAAVVTTVVGLSHAHTGGTAGPAASLHATPSPPHRVNLPVVTPAPGTLAPLPSRPQVTGPSFRATDLTFVSSTSGWALGTAGCVTGRCTTLYRTTDGHTWTQLSRPPFRAARVPHVRFADDQNGYAFGPDELYATTDGGKSWTRQTGGALGLEIRDGEAIRLVAHGSGCPGPCDLNAERAAVGSSTWSSTPVLPGQAFLAGASFVRSGGDAYVVANRNPAGGGDNETSTLFRSTDAGRSWTHRSSDPCPQRGGEVDTATVAAGPGDTVTALCVPRLGTRSSFVAISSDAGATFRGASGALPGHPSDIVGNPGTELVAYGDDGAYRSTDAGATWHRIAELRGPVTFLGFESETVGRAVTDGGRSVWTTSDGGASWSRVTFP